jgi:formate hydrogenlyase transcriptional activator
MRIGAVIVEATQRKKLEKSLHEVSQRLQTELQRVQILQEVGSVLSSSREPREFFPQVSARIRRLLRQEYASLALRDASSGLLVRQSLDFPLGKGFVSAIPISANDSPGGRALQARVPLIFSEQDLRDIGTELTNGILAEGLQSLCCLPLVRPNATLGVVALGSTRPDAFHADDLDLLNQIATQLAIAIENHRTTVEIEALKQRLSVERKFLEGNDFPHGSCSEIIGQSSALGQVLDQVLTVAPSDATVLVLGETGTGKELIARAIHRHSNRKDGPFLKLNCAAIPTGLLESELFGHEKGAFTGAISQKIGRMELAHGGTLFLDEVGEIPLDLQPKLLRVLQDHEFERLGATRTLKVDVRLIAATNRNLEQQVADYLFRSDLYYRLNVFPIRIPALRHRREDIPLLVRYFVHKFAHRMKRNIETIPAATMETLTRWSWPGNVRELENLIERSVILTQGQALRVPLGELHAPENLIPIQPDQSLDNAEREHIIRVLRETHGILSGPQGAARRLGLKRTTLQSKMQRLNITRSDYLDPAS